MPPSTLKAVAPQVTDRDLAILRFLFKFRQAETEQLAELFIRANSSESRERICRRVLARLTVHAYVTRLESRAVGGDTGGSSSYVYTLGPAAEQVLEVRFRRPKKPGLHTLAITSLYVELVRNCELAEFQTEPDCWRRLTASTWLKPDGYVEIVSETEHSIITDRWFVEVDMDQESGPRFASQLDAYRRYYEGYSGGVMRGVMILVPHTKRLEQIKQLIETQPAPELFTVALYDRALEAFQSEP